MGLKYCLTGGSFENWKFVCFVITNSDEIASLVSKLCVTEFYYGQMRMSLLRSSGSISLKCTTTITQIYLYWVMVIASHPQPFLIIASNLSNDLSLLMTNDNISLIPWPRIVYNRLVSYTKFISCLYLYIKAHVLDI